MRNGKTTRTLRPKDYPWLDRSIASGTELTEHVGPTYGCVTEGGIACDVPGIQGFIEIPLDAIEWAPTQEEIEELYIKARDNFGSPKFDRILADDENGRTLFYDGDRLSMIVPIPFEKFDAMMNEAVNKGVYDDTLEEIVKRET